MARSGIAVVARAVIANGKEVTCTMRFGEPSGLVAAGVGATQLADFADAAQTAMNLAGFLALYSPDMQLGPCGAYAFELFTPAPPKAPYWGAITPEITTTLAVTNGTHAGQSTPPQVALVQTLRAAGVGRQGVGRLFTFPPPEGVVEPSGLCTDVIDRLNAWNTLEQAAQTAIQAWEPTLSFSVFTAKFDDNNDVFSTTMNSRVDTQRRRLSR